MAICKRAYATLRSSAGIGPAKARKPVRLKRPRLVPIYDSVVARVYTEDHCRSLATGGEFGFWVAVQSDLRRAVDHGDLKQVREAVAKRIRIRVR